MEGSRAEMRAACGLRRVTVSLDPQTLALVRIAVATATGDEVKLRDRMIAARALHPAIEPLVVVDAYGKILGRPGLDSKRRELCTLAAIAMLNAPRQLHAHLRGALHTGSTREDVDAVLAMVEMDLTKDRALRLWEMWADVRERSLDAK